MNAKDNLKELQRKLIERKYELQEEVTQILKEMTHHVDTIRRISENDVVKFPTVDKLDLPDGTDTDAIDDLITQYRTKLIEDNDSSKRSTKIGADNQILYIYAIEPFGNISDQLIYRIGRLYDFTPNQHTLLMKIDSIIRRHNLDSHVFTKDNLSHLNKVVDMAPDDKVASITQDIQNVLPELTIDKVVPQRHEMLSVLKLKINQMNATTEFMFTLYNDFEYELKAEIKRQSR